MQVPIKAFRVWASLAVLLSILGCPPPQGSNADDQEEVELTLGPGAPGPVVQRFDVDVLGSIDDASVFVTADLDEQEFGCVAEGGFAGRLTLEDLDSGRVWDRELEPSRCAFWHVDAELPCDPERGCLHRLRATVESEGLGETRPFRLRLRAQAIVEGRNDDEAIDLVLVP